MAAVVRYEKAAADVARLTDSIKLAIIQCPQSVKALAIAPDEPGGAELYAKDGRVKTHLWEAYRRVARDDYGPDEAVWFLNHGDSTEETGEGCANCAEAWHLINSRKLARLEFGLAKRSIRGLGKSFIKAVQP